MVATRKGHGRTAFITGASTGIGLVLAQQLAHAGWKVALQARRAELLQREVEALTAKGADAMAVVGDVAELQSVQDGVGRVEQAWGKIDLAVANAGISRMTSARKLDSGAIQQLMQTNFMGTVHLMQAVMPGMVARDSGHFVGVASLAGLRGAAYGGAYGASKAAMQAFLESARCELSQTPIKVSVVNLGFVLTPMTANLPFETPGIADVEPTCSAIIDFIEARGDVMFYPPGQSTVLRLLRFTPPSVWDWFNRNVRAKER